MKICDILAILSFSPSFFEWCSRWAVIQFPSVCIVKRVFSWLIVGQVNNMFDVRSSTNQASHVPILIPQQNLHSRKSNMANLRYLCMCWIMSPFLWSFTHLLCLQNVQTMYVECAKWGVWLIVYTLPSQLAVHINWYW